MSSEIKINIDYSSFLPFESLSDAVLYLEARIMGRGLGNLKWIIFVGETQEDDKSISIWPRGDEDLYYIAVFEIEESGFRQVTDLVGIPARSFSAEDHVLIEQKNFIFLKDPIETDDESDSEDTENDGEDNKPNFN